MPKRIVVSVHDVTPHFEEELNIIFKDLNKLGVKKKTILVTPLWAGKNDIMKEKKFLKRLLVEEKNGAELALHGYTHKINHEWKKKEGFRWKAFNVAEFILAKDIPGHLKRGKNAFKQVFGYEPEGFVPPGWRQKPSVYKLLEQEGFKYVVTMRGLYSLKTKKRRYALPIYFDSGALLPSYIIGYCSAIIAPLCSPSFIRLAIHPDDVKRNLLKSQLDLINKYKKRGYTFTTYEQVAHDLDHHTNTE
jgi:hypothetical protein